MCFADAVTPAREASPRVANQRSASRATELGPFISLPSAIRTRLASQLIPRTALVRRWIDAATALLTESTSSISSIARVVGFRTASHFATTVRRITGMTPSAYRARARR